MSKEPTWMGNHIGENNYKFEKFKMSCLSHNFADKITESSHIFCIIIIIIFFFAHEVGFYLM